MNFRTFKYTFWHFQFKEFLEIYNRTTERCFRDCIVDLSRRDLTTEEDKCLDDCTTKLTKLNHRLLGTFMVEQPRFTQKKYVSNCFCSHEIYKKNNLQNVNLTFEVIRSPKYSMYLKPYQMSDPWALVAGG